MCVGVWVCVIKVVMEIVYSNSATEEAYIFVYFYVVWLLFLLLCCVCGLL